jgi:hypothetical protein
MHLRRSSLAISAWATGSDTPFLIVGDQTEMRIVGVPVPLTVVWGTQEGLPA